MKHVALNLPEYTVFLTDCNIGLTAKGRWTWLGETFPANAVKPCL